MVVSIDIRAAVNAACFSSNKLCDIRILFLRHDTASGAVCVVDVHKLVLIGIPDDDLLGEAAKDAS